MTGTDPAPARADLTSEVRAMATVADALADLPAEAAIRVLEWALKAIRGQVETASSNEWHALEGAIAEAEPQDFPELFNMARPSSEKEKALLAAYWLSKDGDQDFTALQANRLLRNLGHAIGNITREFDRLMAEKPQLVIQTRKSGSAKQARKMYRITTAGRKRVQEMLEE